ncbi:TetR family transcriptional regulator [Jatrophihabitans sp.]|uniref:TetR family transcriptional regulator n=1 Tax=Jatrophihabitans sp. TaxID=1932789 RepID=UPI0030C71F4C|nr:transcriptional regulator, TetR family [Jatrophihabitans sp.]
MPRDAAATRARILAAAVEEFAQFGEAGARIDRIAEIAGANKRSIYVYFGNKDGLFDATLVHVIDAMTTEVPLTETDLPGYAGRLFDYLLEHPEGWRLSMWRQLERPASGPDDSPIFARKIKAMHRSSAPKTGLPPTDLIALVMALTVAWFINPTALLTADGADIGSPARIATHRAALVEAARRICEPQSVESAGAHPGNQHRAKPSKGRSESQLK